MEYVMGMAKKQIITVEEILTNELFDQSVNVNGMVHTVRDMGSFIFLVLRNYEGLIQCVMTKDTPVLKEGAAVMITGTVEKEERAPHGFEIKVANITVLSEPGIDAMLPLPISKWKLNTSLETKVALRPISLRNIRERSIFKIQEGLVRGFREFLYDHHFTEVRTPKLVAGNAEGGANVFKLEYFGKKAFLAQSPQFYKQTLVGVYDRVFEIGPVFRAEKHNTTRHLNEYTSVDFEMGYIHSFYELMEMEQEMLKFTFAYLEKHYTKELKILDVTLPKIEKIPVVRFDEVKALVSEKYQRKMKNPYDLEPEEEQLIGKYFKDEYDSDFVFVTHYPSKKRPFYAMDDPGDTKFTLSFDLLFKGMEITTGGQRIHEYDCIVKKMEERQMDLTDFKHYLSIFKYGMPPHGGLGLGLERLTMRLLGEENVRETTMFPRDVSRLEP